MTRWLLILLVLVALLAACGGAQTDSGEQMVWCGAPGEIVDAEFKREYPDLYMPAKLCDAFEEQWK